MTDKEKELQAEAIGYYRKQIAELEKENKTVSRKADEAIADKLLMTAKYNEILNDLNQQNDKLEKENAELKEQLNKHPCVRKDYYCSDCLKDIEKAKELLNEFMRISKASDEDFEHDYSELIGETEQFLSEVEK